MSRWDISNNVEYKGVNVVRRNLIETINYDNACNILNYAKFLHDKRDVKRIYNLIGVDFSRFVIFVYEELEDKLFTDITEEDIDGFMFWEKKRSDISLGYLSKIINLVGRFYDFLIMDGIAATNPTNKAKKLLNTQRSRQSRHKKLSTNYITDEQLEQAKEKLLAHLKLYMLFSISTGIENDDLRNLQWEQINFDNRTVEVHDAILYFNKEVSELLKNEHQRREDNNLNDNGYVFRSHIKSNFDKDMPIGMNTVCNWCKQIGEILNIPNLRHLDFRHTLIKKLLSATGSVGMTSILTNYPFLTTRARSFIDENSNDELLSRYKDICEI